MELAGEKLDLIAYQFFERLSDVEIEMAGVVAFDLPVRCSARVSEGLARWRDGVGVADAEQDWKSIFLAARPGREWRW